MTTRSSTGLTSPAGLIVNLSMKYNFMHFVMLLRKHVLPPFIAESKPRQVKYSYICSRPRQRLHKETGLQTLPRLELCGATLVAKMVHLLLIELNFNNSKAF